MTAEFLIIGLLLGVIIGLVWNAVCLMDELQQNKAAVAKAGEIASDEVWEEMAEAYAKALEEGVR